MGSIRVFNHSYSYTKTNNTHLKVIKILEAVQYECNTSRPWSQPSQKNPSKCNRNEPKRAETGSRLIKRLTTLRTTVLKTNRAC